MGTGAPTGRDRNAAVRRLVCLQHGPGERCRGRRGTQSREYHLTHERAAHRRTTTDGTGRDDNDDDNDDDDNDHYAHGRCRFGLR